MSGRLRVLAGMTLAGFVVIAGQLWYLQVLEGPRLAELSDRNRIRVRPVAAARGMLYDRNGLPLVEARPALTLSVVPRDLDDRDAVLARLSILLNVPFGELQATPACRAPSGWPAARVDPDAARSCRRWSS